MKSVCCGTDKRVGKLLTIVNGGIISVEVDHLKCEANG